MSAPNNYNHRDDTSVLKGVLAIIAVVAFAAIAIGVAMGQTPVPKSGATPVPTPTAQARGAYQMRCWQYGRLILEESLAQAPAEGIAQSVRLQGASAAYTLLNSSTTTCLVKPSSERWAYVPGTR